MIHIWRSRKTRLIHIGLINLPTIFYDKIEAFSILKLADLKQLEKCPKFPSPKSCQKSSKNLQKIFKNSFKKSSKMYTKIEQLKVRQSRKQIMISSILPKNKRNSLNWVKNMLRIVSFVHFLGELRKS